MAIDDALWMLAADYWEPVWLGLTSAQRSDLASAVSDLTRARPDEDTFYPAVLAVLEVLRGVLPYEHPVLEAADETYRLIAPLAPPVDWGPVVLGLSRRIAVIAHDDVRERLSRSPAVTADQIRAAGSDPADPLLIRLRSTSGGVTFPAFQFDPAGRPITTVLMDAARSIRRCCRRAPRCGGCIALSIPQNRSAQCQRTCYSVAAVSTAQALMPIRSSTLA